MEFFNKLLTILGRLTLSEGLDDQSEVKESQKDNVEFIEAREDAAEAFASAEEPLDLVALAVHGVIILPGIQAIVAGRNHREEAKVQSQLERLVVRIGTVQDEIQRGGQRSDAAQQLAAFDRVGGLARRESNGDGRSSIRGNQMHLGGPSAAGFSDGLGSVLFNAPMPSGCTLTVVESSLTASILRSEEHTSELQSRL